LMVIFSRDFTEVRLRKVCGKAIGQLEKSLKEKGEKEKIDTFSI
jgi:hypothetical protein